MMGYVILGKIAHGWDIECSVVSGFGFGLDMYQSDHQLQNVLFSCLC